VRILIVGLSTRAIAESAVVGGYDVITLDYFGDRDQRALVPNVALQRDFDLPFSAEALLEASKRLEYDGVTYTSSLENHPEVVGELARGRRLLGNTPDVLSAVRGWATLRAVCDEEEIPYPTTLLPGEEGHADETRRWLRKPTRSGGGHGTRPWEGERLDGDVVVQRMVTGCPASAAFVADGRRSVVIGLSEQLIGRQELGGEGYMWCGNILPLPTRATSQLDAVLETVKRVARRLTRRFGLRGVNGIDFVVSDDSRGWPHPFLVEVNPRYTASMELADRAYGLSAFDLHMRSFEGHLPRFSLREALRDARFHGKGIVYAAKDGTVPDTANWRHRGRRDIPFSGEKIEAGHPICTVVASGETREMCWQRLVERAEEVQREMGPGEGERGDDR
jgi:hypothetical protein